MVSAAHRGGGYHLLCHACGHEWDDRHASHHARAAASVNHEPPVILDRAPWFARLRSLGIVRKVGVRKNARNKSVATWRLVP